MSQKKDKLEIERKWTLHTLPLQSPVQPERLNIIQRYGDGFRIRATERGYSRNERGIFTYHHTVKTEVDYSDFPEEVEREIPESEYQSLIGKTNKALGKIRFVHAREDGLKWEVDLYKGVDQSTVELEIPTEDHEFEIEEWMSDVIDEEVTGNKDYTNFNLAFPTLSMKEAMEVKPGTKVFFIPDGNVYDYAYVGQTGKIIVYKEGEKSMQDSFAMDHYNLSLELPTD